MTEVNDNTAQRDRSPAYPIVPLEVALTRLAEFQAHFKYSAARREKVGEAWRIKAKSYADRMLAALGYFGLLESKEGGIVMSEEGRKYLRAQQEQTKQEVVKAAALRPKQIAKFWAAWGADRPADAACIDELTLKNGFSDVGARGFLKVYVATISYAKLSDSDKSINSDQVTKEDDPPSLAVTIGDLVQVDIGGVFQLPQPACVRAIQDHEGKKWVFVEGSETGIPMEQAVIQAKGAPPAVGAATPPRLPESKHEIATQNNEREWLRGPLSKETTYRLIVTGDLGPKEIGKLIKLLTAQQAVLSDDEEDEDEAAH